MLFDTHVNLHAEQFASDLPDVMKRAREAGVTRFVSAGRLSSTASNATLRTFGTTAVGER